MTRSGRQDAGATARAERVTSPDRRWGSKVVSMVIFRSRPCSLSPFRCARGFIGEAAKCDGTGFLRFVNGPFALHILTGAELDSAQAQQLECGEGLKRGARSREKGSLRKRGGENLTGTSFEGWF